MPATDPPAAPPTPALVVIGASIRAWAESVRRAGWRVRGADLFADRDLLDVAEAVAVPPEEYPEGLFTAAATWPPGPWCYCGALENRPDLVDAFSATRPLAGCPGAVVRRVRSAALLSSAFAAAGIAVPEWRDDPAGVPTDGRWLVKPLHSAAGHGIAPWYGTGTAAGTGRVWQERIAGVAVSASFIVDARGARLVGTTEQLHGVAAWHAPPFAWCGAIDVAPGRLPERQAVQWDAIGRVLHEAFGVIGAAGVDAVLTAEGRIVVLEINPRPTASMELVDRRTGGSLAGEHLAACGLAVDDLPSAPGDGDGPCWAKGILRAARVVGVDARDGDTIDAIGSRFAAEDGRAAIADLPRSGTIIPAGAPILTLFAAGTGPEDARRTLARRVAAIDAAIRAAPGR